MNQFPRLKRLNVQDRLFWAGVDYLTCTEKRSYGGSRLYALGHEIIEAEALEGNEISKWQWKGYVGFRSGSAAVAIREEDSMVQISSDVADRYWSNCLEFATNVSRIDLQLTAELSDARPGVFRNTYKHRYERCGSVRRAQQMRILACDKTGDTVYFGSEKSNRCGRFYDKGMQSHFAPAGKVLRWEMQLRNKAAKFAALGLNAQDHKRACILHHVCNYFDTYRCVLPDVGDGMPWVGGEIARVDQMTRNQRRLAFLERVCRPICDSLIAQGNLALTLEALGLSSTLVDSASVPLGTNLKSFDEWEVN